ncbi:nucleotidyl transferase AbiEii/AbiGii toxin family protein [Candidatus Micrarchaeota archaeon]|nr:nucleotidyl transferase AbiEii/AbiGii toxin family protein [Candidatus Micrarchaeota archaeon]
MNIFEKWSWIKRNWPYIIEEADKLGLVFVGGTALSLILFEEYRASEDIDLYNPNSKGIDNPNGKSEEELIIQLSDKLSKKGFDIKKIDGNSAYVGPNIKIEIFYDGTPFQKIERVKMSDIKVPVFDIGTYAKMKMAALLCRTIYDPRDLVDVFIIQKNTKLPFPDRDCSIIENSLEERIKEISKTRKEDLALFQSKEQIDSLPYPDFEKFKRWLVEWLSGFC